MGSDGPDPSTPHEWLRRARSNLARAAAEPASSQILLEDLCFDAQRAAEKAIKAVLVHRAIGFPKTHAIADLLSLAAQNGVDVPADVSIATASTTCAVEARYPGVSEGVSRKGVTQRGNSLGHARSPLGRSHRRASS